MAIHAVTSTTQASIYRINFYDNDIRHYKGILDNITNNVMMRDFS